MQFTQATTPEQWYQLFILHYFERKVQNAYSDEKLSMSDTVTLVSHISMSSELVAVGAPYSQIQSQLQRFESAWRFYFSS